jgi:hypothetical protein
LDSQDVASVGGLEQDGKKLYDTAELIKRVNPLK